MKLYVKRDRFKKFQKGRIELETAWEWTTIEIALQDTIDQHLEDIKFYEEFQEKYKEDKSEKIDYYNERIAKIRKMLDELNMKNAYSWEEKR